MNYFYIRLAQTFYLHVHVIRVDLIVVSHDWTTCVRSAHSI